MGAERERVVRARAQIIEEKANRDFAAGQYYEKHQYYAAARMYYKGVDQGISRHARRPRRPQTRLEKIRNEPDEPPNYFKWVTGMFEAKKD